MLLYVYNTINIECLLIQYNFLLEFSVHKLFGFFANRSNTPIQPGHSAWVCVSHLWTRWRATIRLDCCQTSRKPGKFLIHVLHANGVSFNFVSLIVFVFLK